MVDLATLYRLIRRMPPGASLLLVGDPGQLAPVGFGLTLHVFAENREIPRTVLTRVMRQGEESSIPSVCAAIRSGSVPGLPKLDVGTTADVQFVDAAPQEICGQVIDILARLGGVGSAQIICSVKRGPGGAVEINRALQSLMGTAREQLRGGFFAGDPVLVTRNDHAEDLMNGELGTALADGAAGGLICRFGARSVCVAAHRVRDLTLGYAITTHKSQGSEFPRVIVPVTRNRLLDRTLLLTAISRAREQVVVTGDRAAFDAAIMAPAKASQRFVGLGRDRG